MPQFSQNEISSLSRHLERFDRHVQSRGARYFREQRVGVLESLETAHGFRAELRGGNQYEVAWIAGQKGWTNTCSCPVGRHCKHAYAAALRLIQIHGFVQGSAPAAPQTTALAATVVEVVTQLEALNPRALTVGERRFVQELVSIYRLRRTGGFLTAGDLARLGIVAPDTYPHQQVIDDAWDRSTPPANTLDLWQYIAIYAENNALEYPAFLRPATHTEDLRRVLAARRRAREVQSWAARLESSLQAPRTEPAPVLLPFEIRLCFTQPKLRWEYRDDREAPWQSARAGMARQWFESLARGATGLAPRSLLLLQHIQLMYRREWSATEVQTLRLDERRTCALLHWMLLTREVRPLLVHDDGQPFDEDLSLLAWRARQIGKGSTANVQFELTAGDGTAVPPPDLYLGGTPPLGLRGRKVYQLPSVLGEWVLNPPTLPREALTPAILARLARQGVALPGMGVARIEIVPLRPRFVCELSSEGASPGPEILLIKGDAVDPDGTAHAVLQPGDWKAAAPDVFDAAHGVIREYKLPDALQMLVRLNALRPSWAPWQDAWQLSARGKGFPELFSSWAADVRQAGIELLCGPELAGLVQPADRARLELTAKPIGEDDGAIDWFDLHLVIRAEDSALTPHELQLLLRARGRFVKLPEKGWRRLQVDIATETESRLKELGMDPAEAEHAAEPRRFHVLQLADERIAGLLPEAHEARIRKRATQLHRIDPPEIPAGLRAELRPYQKEGFHFLAHLAANSLGGVLADDMGLGKTVQTLTWLLWLAERLRGKTGLPRKKPLRALIVCPKSVAPNWQLEAGRFAPTFSTTLLRAGQPLPADTNLLVANYAQLRLAGPLLHEVAWDAVVLDEGQNIKNPQSQTARIARELRASHRVVLTGTPIENTTLDLWSLFAFAMPGLLGTQASFKRTYNDRIDAGARQRLGRRLRHFLLRRTKEQVAAELPPRVEEDIMVELEGEQRVLYDAELKRTRAMLMGATDGTLLTKTRFNILQSLLRLRQICCDPRLLGVDLGKNGRRRKKRVMEPSAHASGTDGASAKMDALFDTLEPLLAEGHRVLVFSQFVTLLELISAELKSRGIAHLTLTGATENRQERVDRFQSPEGEPVFLLSLKAAGSGLNLTAASYVVLMDPWWNPAVEAQAIDRTHRIGQASQVIAYRLLAKGTIEEKIRQLQKTKAELARSIVQEESLSTVLSLEDIRFVLSE